MPHNPLLRLCFLALAGRAPDSFETFLVFVFYPLILGETHPAAVCMKVLEDVEAKLDADEKSSRTSIEVGAVRFAASNPPSPSPCPAGPEFVDQTRTLLDHT